MIYKSDADKEELLVANTSLKVDGLCKEWLLTEESRCFIHNSVNAIDQPQASLIKDVNIKLKDLKIVANSFDIDSDIIYAVFPTKLDSNIIPAAFPNKKLRASLSSSFPPGLIVSHQTSSGMRLTATEEPESEIISSTNVSLVDNYIGVATKKDSGYDLEGDIKRKAETEIIPEFYFPNGKIQDSTTIEFDWTTIMVIYILTIPV
jgi:hypothetical protein